ncbi:MAG: cell wall hydrolase [Vulcanibacillus sp.]
MKLFVKVFLAMFLILSIYGAYSATKIYADAENDYILALENQVALLENQVTQLETHNNVLKEQIRLYDEQILLLEEYMQKKDSEIDRLMGFVRTTEDYHELVRIVEAEAGGESYEGKMQVASVVVNRVSKGFGETVHDVIYQPKQFSPIQDGRFIEVEISNDSILATEEIIKKGSASNALYFMNPTFAAEKSRDWMRTLTYVATVGNHEFYR